MIRIIALALAASLFGGICCAQSRLETPEYLLPGAAFFDSFVEVDGYPLHFREAGTGPVLISVPGSAGLEMSTAKDVLARQFRVIEFDPPGRGTSKPPEGQLTSRVIAETLISGIDKLGIDTYYLLGTSIGGYEAMWMAILDSQRVQALLLEGSMTFFKPGYEGKGTAGYAAMESIIASMDPEDGSWTGVPNVIMQPAEDYARKPWANAAYEAELFRRRVRAFGFNPPDAPRDALEAAARKLTVPTLSMVGTNDEVMSTRMGELYELNMPHAEFLIVDGAAHDIQNTRPEAFVEAVTRFIDSL